jgi:protease I
MVRFLINRSVLLILPAQNFNEEEYLIITHSLEREDINIFIASDANSLCKGENGLKVKNDIQFYNIHECNFGGLILVGGSGMRNYWNNPIIQITAKKFIENKKPVGAICSAPIILARAGLLSGCATCYPDDKNELELNNISYSDSAVVINKNIITARDPSASNEFMKAFLYELAKNN